MSRWVSLHSTSDPNQSPIGSGNTSNRSSPVTRRFQSSSRDSIQLLRYHTWHGTARPRLCHNASLPLAGPDNYERYARLISAAKRPRRDVAVDKAKHGTYFALVYHFLSSVVAQSLPAESAKPLDSKPPRLETSTRCTCLRWAYSALVGDLVQELFRTYAAERGNSAELSARVQLAPVVKRPLTPGVSFGFTGPAS